MSTPGQMNPSTGRPAAPPGPPVVQRRRQNATGGLFKVKKKNPYAQGRVASGSGTNVEATAGPGQGVDAGANGGSQGSQGNSGGATSTSNTGDVASTSARLANPALGNTPGRSVTPIPGRLAPGRPTPGTPSNTAGRAGSSQGSPRTSTAASSAARPSQQPPQPTYTDYPIYLLPRVPSTNPSAATDPLLRALPFPTSLNVIHIRHPPSALLPLPDLSNPAGQLYLNRKDPSAPPPPDPRILQERNEERERIAQVKTPVRQADGTWKVRMWDWANKGEKKDENGETVWKEAADPSMIAPDLVEKAPVDKWKNKGKKGGKFGKRGGRGGGGGGGRGGKSGGAAGEGRVNVKMREQALMYRLHDGRHDLPSDTDSEDSDSEEDKEKDKDNNDRPEDEETTTTKGKKSKKKPATNAGDESPKKERKVKGKTYKRTLAIANARNREKNPFVLEGHFGTEPMLPVPPPGSAAVPAAELDSNDPNMPAQPPVPERQKLRYVSNAISDVKDRYVALLFNKSDVGLRWVGREYTFGVRTEEKRDEREGQEGGRSRWGPRGARRGPGAGGAGAGAVRNPADAAAAAAAVAAGGSTEDVDMELYRPGSAMSDVKPHLQDTGDNPDAFPRMYPSASNRDTPDIKPKIEVKPDPDAYGGRRGRGRDTKPLLTTLADKLAKFEQSDYSYAKTGSGRDIDHDAAEEIQRGRQRDRRGVQKWEDDDFETRGRRGATGRGDVERGAGEDWDVEYTGEQDDEEEVLVNAEEEEFARERDARIKEEYDLANANVGLLQRDEEEDSDDSDDLFGERAEAKKKLKKRERRLKRKLAGENSDESLSESEEESESSSDESDITAPTEEEDVKPDINALNAATASPTKDKGKQRSISPASKNPGSPSAPVKREASPAGTSGRTLSVDRGAGHALAARRALSPAGSRASVEPGSGSRGKKRKGPPAQNTAPPESGSGRPSTPLSKKARANTEGPSPSSSGHSTPIGTDFAMQPIDAPVVSGTGGPASAATGHTPTPAKKHKARGKKSKAGAEGSTTPDTPRSSSVNAGRYGSPAPSSSRQGSPAPSAGGRTQSRGPKKSTLSPQEIEAEMSRLRIATYPGALTARMVRDVLVTAGRPLDGRQLWEATTRLEPADLTKEQKVENQARLKNICKYFCVKTAPDNSYSWNESQRA